MSSQGTGNTQIVNQGVEIDPRDRNWNLDFGIDQVDTTGSLVDLKPDVQDILEQVLIELKKINTQLVLITDQIIKDEDIINSKEEIP